MHRPLIAPLLGGRLDLVLGDELQVMRPRAALERLAYYHLPACARDRAEVLQLVEIFLDEDAAHAHAPSRERWDAHGMAGAYHMRVSASK